MEATFGQTFGARESVEGDVIGLTAPAKTVIELAQLEACMLDSSCCSPEHLLLGVLREGEDWQLRFWRLLELQDCTRDLEIFYANAQDALVRLPPALEATDRMEIEALRMLLSYAIS